ncbi:MAG TPA: N-6 DNA methylase [Bacteroidales bacterium]|nr:N-6 DNA methylase [Bacteroidales bacterium]
MLSTTIKSEIKRLWDKFWSGGISNPLTAIEQISYLLFMRRLDELDLREMKKAEFSGEKYESVFRGMFTLPNLKEDIDKSTLRWSHFKQMEGGEMLAHVQAKVFPFIKQLNGEGTAFGRHMRDAVFIIPKPSLMVEAVSLIDKIYHVIEKESETGQTFQDTQGDMYEFLLSEIASAGKNGQFRTPRHIIQMMVELVNPRLGEKVCDPACGTGGFLLGSYQHILTQYTSKERRFTDENGFVKGTYGDKLTNDKLWKQLKENTFFGYDFDNTMVRIGLMNLMLHGITQPNIDLKDTLSKRYNEDNNYDVILANPPFKGSIDKGDINEGFKLGTTKTELLFVNRIVNSLKMGGRAAVIVPDGVLFGSSNAHRQAREMIINECELQGVISMPSGVFKPYAGVSTAVLVFVKGGKTEKVWFYDMASDGYSLDDKRDKNDKSDIPDIIINWNSRGKSEANDRKAKFFFVPVDDIKTNGYDLSINRYKEVVYEAIEYDSPTEIINGKEGEKGIRQLQVEGLKLLNDLEDILK